MNADSVHVAGAANGDEFAESSSLQNGLAELYLEQVPRRVLEIRTTIAVRGTAQQHKHNPVAINTIAALDMSRYGDVCADIEKRFGDVAARRVGDLNRQIRRWVAEGLREIGLPVQTTPCKATGDGALILFQTSDRASQFAVAFSTVAGRYNESLRSRRPLDQRRFRIGIATGAVYVEKQKREGRFSQQEFAGFVISRVVRLENACRTGEVLIDQGTFDLLSKGEQHHYGDSEIVSGNRAERFPARRRKLLPPAPWD